MRPSTFARKPPGKRGVNKATMDGPQEEFITDEAGTETQEDAQGQSSSEPEQNAGPASVGKTPAE